MYIQTLNVLSEIVNIGIKCLGETFLKALIVTVRFIQTLHYFIKKIIIKENE